MLRLNDTLTRFRKSFRMSRLAKQEMLWTTSTRWSRKVKASSYRDPSSLGSRALESLPVHQPVLHQPVLQVSEARVGFFVLVAVVGVDFHGEDQPLLGACLDEEGKDLLEIDQTLAEGDAIVGPVL